MDRLLEHAKALFIDRQRIALSTLLVGVATTLYIFYSPEIIGIMPEPPPVFSDGASQGFQVIISFNTIGFFLAFSIMVFLYSFWQWLFLPGPAHDYTINVLRGVLGSRTRIAHKIAKRFRVFLDDSIYFDVKCRIKEYGSDEWFVYRLVSQPLQTSDLSRIALLHGLAVTDNRLATWASNDEFHGKLIQFLRAINLAVGHGT